MKFILVLTLLIYSTFKMTENKKKIFKIPSLLFYNLHPPDSFDPLDADKSNNINFMRMLYATPIEVDYHNEMVSSVLDSFLFDQNSNTIEFKVKKNIFYSDGQKITEEDVLYSIARMAYSRPSFPVIKNIKGIKDWVGKKLGLSILPEGLSVHGDTVKIKLDKKVSNPLFRFSLEIFSIIPKKCINLNTNELNCTQPAFSGHYELEYRKNNEVAFNKRNYLMSNKKIPDSIIFKYIDKSVLNKINIDEEANTVLYGLEYSLIEDKIYKDLKNKLHFKYLPNTRFLSILLNSKDKFFNDQSCRLQFANTYRKLFSEQEVSSDLSLSSSIFVKILPGYLEESFFNRSYRLCDYKKLKKLYISNLNSGSLPIEVLKKTIKQLYGDNIELVNVDSDFENKYNSGQLSISFFSSGFWALDVVGDFSMMLTENMHPMLNNLTKSISLKNMISELENYNLDDKSEMMKKINNFIYEDAQLNVVIHTRRFFAASNSKLINELSQTLASVYPWQIFNMDALN